MIIVIRVPIKWPEGGKANGKSLQLEGPQILYDGETFLPELAGMTNMREILTVLNNEKFQLLTVTSILETDKGSHNGDVGSITIAQDWFFQDSADKAK